MRSTRSPRSSSARWVITSWCGSSSSVRIVATSRTRSSRRLRTRKASRSRVDGSAHWRSSMTKTAGTSRASRSTTPRTSSNRRTCANRSSLLACQPDAPLPGSAAVGRSGRERSSGISRASSPRLGPSSAGNAPGSSSRNRSRKASTNGAYGRPPVPSGRHPPVRTRPPIDSTRSANAPTRRVLPIPASPATIIVRVSPAAARAKAAASRSSSAVRAMNAWPRGASTTRR